MLDEVVWFVQYVIPAVVVVVVSARLAHRVITAPRLTGSARSARRRAIAATVLGVLAAATVVVLARVLARGRRDPSGHDARPGRDVRGDACGAG